MTGVSYKNPIEETSIGGYTASQFAAAFLERANYSMPNGSDYAPPTYDAVWAAALALNRTLQKMEAKGIVLFRLPLN